ncbi:type II toxin-antitoxin system VapC family toxin [Nostoc sp. FACHB-87]|uniref:type II toxin-antitoxin system VapC family toxin n=1 Tax=Nostocaceae TaxID=1162 RepID=UPI001688FC3E|nr:MULTISPECIES: type II toxin-antitoxin system VapC family toxin [Nostocaceae]MBD2297756.1 type II toxin-antitoxin system VapC family toxin [Nostoc sp. FACHB-190]MBD2454808.1 type II toxin-antitoxin system VapC family toxin [Nostoc sp. FACHB-87]MBD2476734.1 type II toxin-antitoxin system VapC family toxin [Anabaena sp. FACHB-83]
MTALLLDTHAFIWYSEDDPNLPDSLKAEIDHTERVYLSIATLWEIAIKLNLGKLSLQANYELIEASLEPAGINLLPIAFADTIQILKLPLHHRDPFDRILIAQAIRHNLVIVSRDRAFAAYPVQLLWT